jgi:uncharacterized membrane protein
MKERSKKQREERKSISSTTIDFNSIIGLVLRYGVVVSFIVISVGLILLYIEGQTGYYPVGTVQQLIDRHNRFLIGIVPVLEGVLFGRPYAIILLGLLILLATPVARVFISIWLFLSQRRYNFVAITSFVFAILLISMFVIGPLISM